MDLRWPNTPEQREEIGYTHCTNPSCVGTWRNHRIVEAHLRLVALHKQGLAWVTDDDDTVTNDGRHPK